MRFAFPVALLSERHFVFLRCAPTLSSPRPSRRSSICSTPRATPHGSHSDHCNPTHATSPLFLLHLFLGRATRGTTLLLHFSVGAFSSSLVGVIAAFTVGCGYFFIVGLLLPIVARHLLWVVTADWLNFSVECLLVSGWHSIILVVARPFTRFQHAVKAKSPRSR